MKRLKKAVYETKAPIPSLTRKSVTLDYALG